MVVIKIFDAKDTNFNTAGNIIIEPLYCHEIKKKSLNGWYIDVEIPINYKKYIEQDKLCVVQTKSKLNPQAFRIKDIEYTTNKIVFQAQHVMFDAEDYFLLDSRPTNQNGLNALNYINGMTDKVSPFTIYSNVENISTAYFIRKNLLEAWSIIEERWGGVFDADNWNISFLTSVGNDNGETIYYGKNLEDMKIIEDWSGVCTKLYPVGKDEIMLADKYLESTTQYDIPYTRTIKFDTQLNDEEQTEENLLNELKTNAINYLQENCVPKVCYEINSNINQEMEIGDIIQVKHPLCNISTEVLEYEYDVILGKITKLVFGNYSKDVKKKFKAVTNTIESIKEAVNKQQTTINNQTNLINSLNKNGYVYIDENEILLLDAIPKEKAKNVWRFGLAGIGFSSNGYEGPFEVAITMDGQINADFITTGTMSVSRIEGLANFISETEKQIAEIEIEQGTITSRVSSVETGVNNITNTQGEAEGKSIHIEDSAEEPFVEVELYGESIQEGTPTPDSPSEIENIEGRNKFNYKKLTPTFNINGDEKEFTITAPNVGTTVYEYTGFKTSKQYTLSGFYSSTSLNGVFRIKYSDNTYTVIKAIYDGSAVSKTKFSVASTVNKTIVSIQFILYGNTYDLTFYDFQVEEGTVATPYVPYNSLEFKVEGKNLWDEKYLNGYYSSTGNFVSANNQICTENYIKVVPNETYWLGVYSYVLAICLYDKNQKFINRISFTLSTKNGITYTTDDKTHYIKINFSDNYGDTYKNDIIIAKSSMPTDYEPYKSQVATFPLGEGEKLMEGSYTGEDGIHNARKQVIFDGSSDEDWHIWALNATNVERFFINLTHSTNSPANTLCSHFNFQNNNLDEEHFRWSSSSLGYNQFMIYINKTRLSDVTVAGIKGYLQANPITVEYELAEPETVPYTEEQQEAWNKIKALRTYKNITNITSDAYVKVTYMRDNGLDVYETKQNAQKKYTETSEKLAEQKMTVDGVITQVSETNKRLTNDYLTAEQVNAELDTTKEDIEIIKQNQVTMTQTSKNLQIAIDTINNEGVSKVKTSMGYTFDDEGFKLNRSNAETGTIIDEAAVKVIDKTGASEQNLLYAGYVKEGNTNYPSYIGQTIVASANMIVQNYLVVPNSRFEEYTNPVLGGKGTGVFEV